MDSTRPRPRKAQKNSTKYRNKYWVSEVETNRKMSIRIRFDSTQFGSCITGNQFSVLRNAHCGYVQKRFRVSIFGARHLMLSSSLLVE